LPLFLLLYRHSFPVVARNYYRRQPCPLLGMRHIRFEYLSCTTFSSRLPRKQPNRLLSTIISYFPGCKEDLPCKRNDLVQIDVLLGSHRLLPSQELPCPYPLDKRISCFPQNQSVHFALQ